MSTRYKQPHLTHTNPDHMVTEVRDRMRRLETRLTKFMEGQGYDTGARRAAWSPQANGDNFVVVPTIGCSLREIMSCIPEGFNLAKKDIDIMCDGEYVATLYVEPR